MKDLSGILKGKGLRPIHSAWATGFKDLGYSVERFILLLREVRGAFVVCSVVCVGTHGDKVLKKAHFLLFPSLRDGWAAVLTQANIMADASRAPKRILNRNMGVLVHN
jgi:hypothetical protein